MYYVWRRSDGYVGCSTYKPFLNKKDTFDILLETKEWSEARKVIEENRDEVHRELVESWK